jgi:hypothetical protein
MKRLLLIALGASIGAASFAQSPDKDGWIKLFDGKTLDGWKASERPATFTVKDGAIAVEGDRAHLFYEGPVSGHNFSNFEFKASVMTQPGSNSGIFIHTAYQETGWPSKGYEVQVNQTHTDWRKTGSIYAVQDVKEVFVKDGEWYTEHIIVQGRKVTVKVNDKIINEYTETTENRLTGGTIALQGHDPKSKVYYRDVMVKLLP